MSNATEILSTVTTIDQNTGRQVTWNIVHVHEWAANVTAQYGWTHSLGLVRPNGRCCYTMDVEMVGNVIARNNRPTKAFGR